MFWRAQTDARSQVLNHEFSRATSEIDEACHEPVEWSRRREDRKRSADEEIGDLQPFRAAFHLQETSP